MPVQIDPFHGPDLPRTSRRIIDRLDDVLRRLALQLLEPVAVVTRDGA